MSIFHISHTGSSYYPHPYHILHMGKTCPGQDVKLPNQVMGRTLKLPTCCLVCLPWGRERLGPLADNGGCVSKGMWRKNLLQQIMPVRILEKANGVKGAGLKNSRVGSAEI